MLIKFIKFSLIDESFSLLIKLSQIKFSLTVVKNIFTVRYLILGAILMYTFWHAIFVYFTAMMLLFVSEARLSFFCKI